MESGDKHYRTPGRILPVNPADMAPLVHECRRCQALVLDKQGHDRWHDHLPVQVVVIEETH